MLREEFPIFEKQIYINSCSKGALSLTVKQAYQQYLSDWQNLGSPWDDWVHKLEQTRSAFVSLINAQPHEVAVKTSVSDAVNALASSLDFSGERNKILVDDFAFPTTAQIWHAQAARGAKLVHIPESADTTIPLEYYEQAIDERTLLVSITLVCYRHGARQDARAIIQLAHERGALVMLDCYQALGTFPIDVQNLNADFVVGGALKYLLGSSGLAYLYVREELIDKLYPTATGWFAQADIFAMDIYHHNPSPTARRFESGTPPNPNLYAALAGLQLIEQVGVENIEAHLNELTGALKEGAYQRGYQIVTPDLHGAMIALKSQDVNQLVACLAGEKIIVSSRDDNLRVSAHFYNESSDIDVLLNTLKKYEHLLVFE